MICCNESEFELSLRFLKFMINETIKSDKLKWEDKEKIYIEMFIITYS